MLDQLDSIYEQALAELETLADGETLAEWQRRYLGKKGEVTLRCDRHAAQEQRAAFGQRANALRDALSAAYAGRDEAIRQRS